MLENVKRPSFFRSVPLVERLIPLYDNPLTVLKSQRKKHDFHSQFLLYLVEFMEMNRIQYTFVSRPHSGISNFVAVTRLDRQIILSCGPAARMRALSLYFNKEILPYV